MSQVNPDVGRGLKLDMNELGGRTEASGESDSEAVASKSARHVVKWIREKYNRWQKLSMTADRLDRICRILFPVAFLIFNIFYWFFYAVMV